MSTACQICPLEMIFQKLPRVLTAFMCGHFLQLFSKLLPARLGFVGVSIALLMGRARTIQHVSQEEATFQDEKRRGRYR